MKNMKMKHEDEDMEKSEMHKVHGSKQMKKHDRKMKGKGPKKY